MDLHSTAPAVPTFFWVELDLKSFCFDEWLSLSQISGLTRGVAGVSQFAGRKYFSDLSFSFESGNFLDDRLLIKSASCFSAAVSDSSALRKSSAISDNNGSLPPSLARVEHVGYLWKFCRLQCHKGPEVPRSSHLHLHLNDQKHSFRLWKCVFAV